MSKIILASASPRRKELLAKAGISFTVIPAAGEEKTNLRRPGEAVQQLARDKAECGRTVHWLNAKKELW